MDQPIEVFVKQIVRKLKMPLEEGEAGQALCVSRCACICDSEFVCASVCVCMYVFARVRACVYVCVYAHLDSCKCAPVSTTLLSLLLSATIHYSSPVLKSLRRCVLSGVGYIVVEWRDDCDSHALAVVDMLHLNWIFTLR